MIDHVKVKDPVQNQVARKIVLVKVLHDQNGTCCVNIHKGVSTEKGGMWRGKISRMRRGETRKGKKWSFVLEEQVLRKGGQWRVWGHYQLVPENLLRFSLFHASTSTKIIVSFLTSFFDDNVLQESTLSMRKRMESRSLLITCRLKLVVRSSEICRFYRRDW